MERQALHGTREFCQTVKVTRFTKLEIYFQDIFKNKRLLSTPINLHYKQCISKCTFKDCSRNSEITFYLDVLMNMHFASGRSAP